MPPDHSFAPTQLSARAAYLLRGNDLGVMTTAAPLLYPHMWSWDAAFVSIGLASLTVERAVVELDNKLANRSVNEGFSGGEKKRNEIFQMAMLEPKLSILDETDSGLDIDALRIVAEGVNKLKTPETSCIVITHYQRLLDYIKSDIVHVLYKGRIVKTAGPELALELEERGYDWIKAEADTADR